MKQLLLPLILLFFFILNATAQGTAFGLKGGLTLGVQKWSGFDQGPLFKYHGSLSMESLDETSQFSIYTQLGYHLKGSALRNQNAFDFSGNFYRLPAQEFIFKNVSLVLGAKRKYQLTDAMRGYYLFGLRGDYTIGTNLNKYKEINDLNGSLFYPVNDFVKKWNYGVTLGGGFEVAFGELIEGVLEFTVNPDFSFQYRQPDIPNVYNPYTRQTGTIPSRDIRNVTFEISAGFRFLRRVEYLD